MKNSPPPTSSTPGIPYHSSVFHLQTKTERQYPTMYSSREIPPPPVPRWDEFFDYVFEDESTCSNESVMWSTGGRTTPELNFGMEVDQLATGSLESQESEIYQWDENIFLEFPTSESADSEQMGRHTHLVKRNLEVKGVEEEEGVICPIKIVSPAPESGVPNGTKRMRKVSVNRKRGSSRAPETVPLYKIEEKDCETPQKLSRVRKAKHTKNYHEEQKMKILVLAEMLKACTKIPGVREILISDTDRFDTANKYFPEIFTG